MKIIIAPDKFKGSLSAREVCLAIQKGIHRFDSTIETILCPLADGGDGSLEVLDYYLDLETISVKVADPLLRPIISNYKIGGKKAYIEMSAASGLVLLAQSERNCMHTSTLGTGQLIADALQRGATEINLFIGGSATNDGGIGMAQALGYRFYDKNENNLVPIGKNLVHIASIDNSTVFFNSNKIKVKVVCDVTNPFFGENGAAFIYGSQKGASEAEVQLLDKGLRNLVTILNQQKYPTITALLGAGAAGGLGGGAVAFLKANIVSGISTFLNLIELEDKLKEVDFIITGEGKIDSQTEQGKVISGVVDLAKKYQIPVIAICGTLEIVDAKRLGIQQIYTLLSVSKSVKESMKNAREKLEYIAFRIFDKKNKWQYL